MGKGKLLRQLIEQDKIPSMIFWGPRWAKPPGGNIAKRTNAQFINFSAVTSGIKEIKEVMVQLRTAEDGIKTLYLWTRYRFTKAQQDAFLPYVEKEASF